ncbi:hypothetical protein ENBRE01_2876, partial [Enteropsectra breve]
MRYSFSILEIEEMKAFLLNETLPININKSHKANYKRKLAHFHLQDNKLFKIHGTSLLEVVGLDSVDQRNAILKSIHLPDHAGIKAMHKSLKRQYCGIWRLHVDQFVGACEICQRHQPLVRASAITPIITNTVWERVRMDCVDLRHYVDENDGYGWILTILDTYSKYLYAHPMKTKSASEVVQSFKPILYQEGAPQIIQTDNGREFVNSQLEALCAQWGIMHVRGRPRHPQNQGQVERVNQTLVRKIAKALEGIGNWKWIDILPDIVFSYNMRWHRAINQYPFMAFRMRQCNIPQGRNIISAEQMTTVSDPQLESDNIYQPVFEETLEQRDLSSEDLIEMTTTTQSTELSTPLNVLDDAYRENYVRAMV